MPTADALPTEPPAVRTAAAAHEPGPETAALTERLLKFALELHREPSVSHVALVAANESRSLLGCDRVTLAAAGPRRRLFAVSGQEQVVTRSSLSQAMAELGVALGEAAKPFWYQGDADLLPAELRAPVVEFVRLGGARSVEAFPLRQSLPPAAPDAAPRGQTIAWLICEQFGEPTVCRSVAARAIAEHVALALSHALEFDRRTTLPRRALGHFFGPGDVANPRRARLITAALVAVIALVGLLPVRYRVEAAGRLAPVRRAQVFAPSDARVREVLVDGNQTVARGQVVLRLENSRLTSELLAVRHLLEEKQQLVGMLEAQLAAVRERPGGSETIRLNGAIAQARIEAHGTARRLAMLEAEAAELDVQSPIDGTVATFQPRQALHNRPVDRGEPLLEVIDAAGPWEIELDLPAHRLGLVLAARASDPTAPRTVEFALATEPETAHVGALQTVAARVVTTADGLAVAPLEASVAIEQIAHPVAGADVVARIDCGPRALAGVLFGDVVDAIRRWAW